MIYFWLLIASLLINHVFAGNPAPRSLRDYLRQHEGILPFEDVVLRLRDLRLFSIDGIEQLHIDVPMLDLSDNCLEDISPLGRMYNVTIKAIILDNNCITEFRSTDLEKLLTSFPNLKTLSLALNPFTVSDEDYQSFKQVVFDSFSLTKLYLPSSSVLFSDDELDVSDIEVDVDVSNEANDGSNDSNLSRTDTSGEQ